MESEEQVKKLLSCLIISSPKATTVRRLQQDYQSEIGKNVPYKSFGYDTLEKYLLSIPDVCQLNGTGPMAIVEPVISDKVKHINNMIIKQKTLARPKGIEVKPKAKTVRFAFPLTSLDLLKGYQAPLQDEACGYSYPTTPPATNKDYYNDANSRLRATSQDVLRSDQARNSQQPERLPQISTQNGTQDNRMRDSRGCISTQVMNVKYQPDRKPMGAQSYLSSNSLQPNLRSTVAPSTVLPQRDSPVPQTNDVHESDCRSPQTGARSEAESDVQEPERKSYSRSQVLRLLLQRQREKKNAENKAKEENAQADPSLARIPTILDLPRGLSTDALLNGNKSGFADSTPASSLDLPRNNENHLQNRVTESRAPIVQMSMTEYVTCNLRLLIKENPTGIWSLQLANYYKSRFRDTLDPRKFGFNTVNDFCETLTDVFVIIRLAGDDWKLFDINNPPLHLLTQEKTCCISELYGNNIPEEVMLMDDVIEPQWLLEGVKRGMYVDIVIGEVFNPHKFYIQFTREDDYNEKYLDNMEEFYGRMHTSYRINVDYIEDGLYCIAYFRNQFNRAIIQSRVNDDTVLVYSIDFGTLMKVKHRDLYFLNRKFSSLPQQAIRSRLSCIAPQNGTTWPYEASKRFFDLCLKKDLVGNLNYIDEKNFILYLVITDITDATDIHINDTLIDEGYAVLDFSQH